jgi:hypothetical protein
LVRSWPVESTSNEREYHGRWSQHLMSASSCWELCCACLIKGVVGRRWPEKKCVPFYIRGKLCRVWYKKAM